jgi:hypothetical protein
MILRGKQNLMGGKLIAYRTTKADPVLLIEAAHEALSAI